MKGLKTMLALVRNDIRANSQSLILMFVLLNGTFILALLDRLRLEELILAGLWFALIVPLPILLRAEQFKSVVHYRSVPVRISNVVWGKYCGVVLVAVATIAYTFVYVYAIESGSHVHRLGYSLEAGYAYPHTLIARFLFYVGVLAVGIPLIFAVGSFIRILWGAIVVLIIRNLVINRLLDFSLHSTFAIGINAWVFVVLVGSILVLILSHEISVWILAQRDL